MRIGLLIGGLGRGGSERQLIELANGLVKRGHAVEIVVYGSNGPNEDYFQGKSVVVKTLEGNSKWEKLLAVRRWLTQFEPDILHGFMKRASMVAILADLPRLRHKIIASDFSTATYSRYKPILWAALVSFSMADCVVTQTEMNRRSLGLLAPWLRKKIVIVRNGVDIHRFKPAFDAVSTEIFKFICVGTVYQVKNPVRVVEAVNLLRKRNVKPFKLDWYGRLGPRGDACPSEQYIRAKERAQDLGVETTVIFHGETANIEQNYLKANAVIHASLQEGIPNAVVEGMASGLPVVVSKVSDLPLIVSEGRNGFVCDETDPVSIANAMQKMLEMSDPEQIEMGARSRDLAVKWFGLHRFVSDYENLYQKLLGNINSVKE